MDAMGYNLDRSTHKPSHIRSDSLKEVHKLFASAFLRLLKDAEKKGWFSCGVFRFRHLGSTGIFMDLYHFRCKSLKNRIPQHIMTMGVDEPERIIVKTHQFLFFKFPYHPCMLYLPTFG